MGLGYQEHPDHWKETKNETKTEKTGTRKGGGANGSLGCTLSCFSSKSFNFLISSVERPWANLIASSASSCTALSGFGAEGESQKELEN